MGTRVGVVVGVTVGFAVGYSRETKITLLKNQKFMNNLPRQKVAK